MHAVLYFDSAGIAGHENKDTVFAVGSFGDAGDEDGRTVLAVDFAGKSFRIIPNTFWVTRHVNTTFKI